MKCKISTLGFFALDIKRHTQAQKEMKREKEVRTTLIKTGRNAISKHSKLKKRQTAYLSIPNSLNFPHFDGA